MSRELDALTAPTLKYLRERWWDEAFTRFLIEVLQPAAGRRLLDVGCGPGTAEQALTSHGVDGVTIVGVDVALDALRRAVSHVASRRVSLTVTAGDACALPFDCAAFDGTFCVAVLQHANNLSEPVHEFARVTRPGGHVLVVEPDNSARYWYSSSESGMRAFELGSRFYNAVALSRGDTSDPAVGPKLAQLFRQHRIQPTAVRVFPVSQSRLGALPWPVWENRLESARQAIENCREESIKRLGFEYCQVLERYAEEAAAAGGDFIEVQTTLLFATAGTRDAE